MAELNQIIEELKQNLLQSAKRDFRTAMDHTISEVETEARNMYNTMIAQFYSYHTTSYIRHWEQRPGTEKGSNLYYANNIKKRHSNGVAYLYVNFGSDEMAGGYEYDPPSVVLETVLLGLRGPVEYATSWSGYFKGKYFSFDGTIKDAFDHFSAKYEDIIYPIFEKKWHALGW